MNTLHINWFTYHCIADMFDVDCSSVTQAVTTERPCRPHASTTVKTTNIQRSTAVAIGMFCKKSNMSDINWNWNCIRQTEWGHKWITHSQTTQLRDFFLMLYLQVFTACIQNASVTTLPVIQHFSKLSATGKLKQIHWHCTLKRHVSFLDTDSYMNSHSYGYLV